MTTLSIEKINHRGEIRIAIKLPYGAIYVEKIRQIPGRKWSQTRKCWHIPYTPQAFRKLKQIFGDVIINTNSERILSKSETIHKDKYLKNVNSNSRFKVMVEAENEERIKIKVALEDQRNRSIIKKIPGCLWNPRYKYWSLPYTQDTLNHLKYYIGPGLILKFKPQKNIPSEYIAPSLKENYIQTFTLTNLNPAQIEALNLLEEQLLYERCSFRTIKAYLNQVKQLFLYYPATHPEKISDDQIKDYIIFKIKTSNISISAQNQFINATKAYYKRVLQQDREILDLRRPKKPNHLPHILSEQEVIKILSSVENLKHKCILMLIYSAGLRVSEVVNLKIKDIDSERMQIFIQGGKGKKDRYTLLSQKALVLLRLYFKQYRPYSWLFEGIHGGKYSTRSVQNIFQKATGIARIKKRVTLHTLRHSFATHLLEKGISLRYIQNLLGHESSQTTEIYTHITKQSLNNIQSPLDRLDF